jgi:FAD-dependent urate hydroxylase
MHMKTPSEVIVIGAGPFGLSISAHLRELGVDHRIVGRPMNTWRAHMPVGMNMKSEPYATDIAAPKPGYSLSEYCRLHGLDYVDRGGPVTLQRFLDYADWYTGQLTPDVADITVTGVAAVAGGFQVTFADAEPLTARQVVLATGVLPYAAIPDELSGLPGDLVSHTIDHHDLERFRGRRVIVLGGGQSALETAALLHEAGAHTQIVMRRPVMAWNDPNPDRVSRIGQLRRPVVKLCEGWKCTVWNSPAAFRRLPRDMRITKARTVLGPAGSWWLKERIDGVIDVLTNHRPQGAKPNGSGVRLQLDGPEQSAIDADHIICGTGFRVDLARLSYLPDELRGRIATLNGYPVLSRAGESTVPGLYFAGAPAAVSLGPSERFIAGTHNAAAKLARSAARHTGAKDRGTAPERAEQALRPGADPTFQETA